MDNWISVKENNPENKGNYLIYIGTQILLAYYSGDDYWSYGYYSNRIMPLFWVPLPEPPK